MDVKMEVTNCKQRGAKLTQHFVKSGRTNNYFVGCHGIIAGAGELKV
jgi:hypothetical protein